ncbi:hypothetical protein BRPE64_BCDS07720 [Caballeronia insecticola]|uniref:Uncharacterized protein n=1 Tax=Caballeronia insecticola TaxID=758793 RepID=R4WLG4_9BURK|nr:hypothetical protein BRPE64_BCDS07720 [Caballeronia insecticola]
MDVRPIQTLASTRSSRLAFAMIQSQRHFIASAARLNGGCGQ